MQRTPKLQQLLVYQKQTAKYCVPLAAQQYFHGQSDCGICFDTVTPADSAALPCCARLCRSCAVTSVTTDIAERRQPRCPAHPSKMLPAYVLPEILQGACGICGHLPGRQSSAVTTLQVEVDCAHAHTFCGTCLAESFRRHIDGCSGGAVMDVVCPRYAECKFRPRAPFVGRVLLQQLARQQTLGSQQAATAIAHSVKKYFDACERACLTVKHPLVCTCPANGCEGHLRFPVSHLLCKDARPCACATCGVNWCSSCKQRHHPGEVG